jgi:hypothetical protein
MIKGPPMTCDHFDGSGHQSCRIANLVRVEVTPMQSTPLEFRGNGPGISNISKVHKHTPEASCHPRVSPQYPNLPITRK